MLMHRLVRASDYEGLKNLLESSSEARKSINTKDEGDATPLFYALNQDSPDFKVVELLLKNGADPQFVRVQKIPGIINIAGGVFSSIAESIGIKIRNAFQDQVHRFEEPVLRSALKNADLETIKLLHESGADFSYRDRHDYTAVLDASCRLTDPLPVVDFLISLGLDINVRSSYGESAIVKVFSNRHFRTVARLLQAGADESLLQWTPLIRAVSIGTLDDVKREAPCCDDIDASCCCDRTALHIALQKADQKSFEVLLAHGANCKVRTVSRTSSIVCAAEGGNTALIKRLVELGCLVDDEGSMGTTALSVAAEQADSIMIQALLDMGADPNAGGRYEPVLEEAKDRATILALVEAGADPAGLNCEGRRRLVGLGDSNQSDIHDCTHEQYTAARFEREGEANPEDLTEPFRLAMIRSGASAYNAQMHFEGKYPYGCPIGNDRKPTVWCFERFGQTFTVLPDDRTVLIGGEHEDGYDPDFRIYNDVTVFEPSGEIRVFGYPYKNFEPTDFHTATLVDDNIYIIGGLGYGEQRKGTIPVYRLSTKDFSIERIKTGAEAPGRIFEHRAQLTDGSRIRIEGGKAISFRGRKEDHNKNTEAYELDVATSAWTKV